MSSAETIDLLYVDLDGTLTGTDTLWESLMLLIKTRPAEILLLPSWLSKGKAHFKKQVSLVAPLNAGSLPYRNDVLTFLEDQKSNGVTLVLATAADMRIAERVQDHLGLFSHILATDGETNLSGSTKRDAIQEHAAGRLFAYIGNSSADIPIWNVSHIAHIVAAPRDARILTPLAGSVGNVVVVQGSGVRQIIHALRIRQWPKNVLIFLPLLLSHRYTEHVLVFQCILGFFSFSSVASALYLWNDLLDLEADRAHETKRARPFAAGTLPIQTGFMLIVALLIAGVLFAYNAGSLPFVLVLAVYAVLSGSYSLGIKRLFLVDVLLLALLYVYRIFAGSILTGDHVSLWLAIFAFFFFLNLAALKRITELASGYGKVSSGRAYAEHHNGLLRGIGLGSGIIALVIFALYPLSMPATLLYKTPWVLWGAVILLAAWNIRLWDLSRKGIMREDPVSFALKDPDSYFTGVSMLLLFALAAVL